MRPFVVGHRGAAGYEPENTLRSLKRGIEFGVQAVEVDVRRCADGALVVMHDPTVDRTTNGKGYVGELTLQELLRLDAGKGERIPAFEEVLRLVKGRCGLVVEIKEPGTEKQTVGLIRDHGLLSKTTIVSFRHQSIGLIKKNHPRLKCGVIFSGRPVNPARLAKDANAEPLLPSHYYVDEPWCGRPTSRHCSSRRGPSTTGGTR